MAVDMFREIGLISPVSAIQHVTKMEEVDLPLEQVGLPKHLHDLFVNLVTFIEHNVAS